MTLEGRLSDSAAQRRALEHTRDAIGRIGALGREASEVASLIERPRGPVWHSVSLNALLAATLERVGAEGLDTSLATLDTVKVRTSDEAALSTALGSLIAATVREAPATRLTLQAAPVDSSTHSVTLALGSPQVIPDLLQGPSASSASHIPLERGGLGLSLVMAVLVLDAHDAAIWTNQDQRAAVAVRLPIETGSTS